MDKLMTLEDHVIEKILGYDDISLDDICNFKLLWEEFHSTMKSNVVPWKRVFFYRWPSAKKFYDKQGKKEMKNPEENEQNVEKDFIERGIHSGIQLKNYVFKAIHYYYNKRSYRIDNLLQYRSIFHFDKYLTNEFNKIIKTKHYINYLFLIDEIRKLLNQSLRRTDCDLTEKYFYEKIFQHIKQRLLRKEFDIYEKESFTTLLEEAAISLARCVQFKNISCSDVKESLDDIARGAMDYLKERHPNHSIFSTSHETFTHWKNNNIDKNYWNETEGTQIMDALQEYIFGKLNFRYDTGDYLEYMCIDNVLEDKKGQDIIIFIIYHSVARRLGLRCDIMKPYNDNSDTYCMFWQPQRMSSKNARCFGINFGEFPHCLLNKPLEVYLQYYESYRIKPIEVLDKTNNICKTTEGLPSSFIARDKCYPHKLYNGMLKLHFGNPQCRNENLTKVKYAVGLIIKHVEDEEDEEDEDCTGVIIAWCRYAYENIQIKRTSIFNECKMCLKLHHINDCYDNYKEYYVILTDNNEMCYVNEDEIQLTAPRRINNMEIGRYFCKFEGTHYEPNEMLANAFPDDYPIRQLIINKIEMEIGVEHSS